MATERTVMMPDGMVVTFNVADQTVMLPSGTVADATIEAASSGGYKLVLHHHYQVNLGTQ